MATKRETTYKLTNLLEFLQNANVILIRDEAEYIRFSRIISHHGLDGLLPTKKGKPLSYSGLLSLFLGTPQHSAPFSDWDGKAFYAECQIGKEAIGIYPYDSRTVVEWYGTQPMEVDDIDDLPPEGQASLS